MHHIKVLDEFNDKIIGINFMHIHKQNCNLQNPQFKLARANSDEIFAMKESVLPACH